MAADNPDQRASVDHESGHRETVKSPENTAATLGEGRRLLDSFPSRGVVLACAGIVGFQALDAGSMEAAVKVQYDKKTGVVDVVRTTDTKTPPARLSFGPITRMTAETSADTHQPSPLFQSISATDLTIPGVNESIANPVAFRTFIGTGIEKAKQKYHLPFASLSSLSLQEAMLISADIVEEAYEYDKQMLPEHPKYSAEYTKMIDGLPTDVRLIKAATGQIRGVVCREYAVDYENVLETILDMTGATWASRIHVDTITSLQQRHAWSVVYQDAPSAVTMGVVDVTFSDNREKEKASKAKTPPHEMKKRDAKDSIHQSLLEVWRSNVGKGATDDEEIEFLTAALDIGEHRVNTLNFSTELLNCAAEKLYVRQSSKQAPSATRAFAESILKTVSAATARFRGSHHIESEALEYGDAAHRMLSALLRHDGLSSQDKRKLCTQALGVTNEAYLIMANLYAADGKMVQAGEWYAEAIKKYRRPHTFKNAIAFYRGQGNTEMAKSALEKFDYELTFSSYYEDDLRAFDGHETRAQIAAELGDRDTALISWGAAFRAARKHPRLYAIAGIEYAKVLVSLGRLDEGKETVKKITQRVREQRAADASWSPNKILEGAEPDAWSSEQALWSYVSAESKVSRKTL